MAKAKKKKKDEIKDRKKGNEHTHKCTPEWLPLVSL